jgi:hypothetical protein
MCLRTWIKKTPSYCRQKCTEIGEQFEVFVSYKVITGYTLYNITEMLSSRAQSSSHFPNALSVNRLALNKDGRDVDNTHWKTHFTVTMFITSSNLYLCFEIMLTHSRHTGRTTLFLNVPFNSETLLNMTERSLDRQTGNSIGKCFENGRHAVVPEINTEYLHHFMCGDLMFWCARKIWRWSTNYTVYRRRNGLSPLNKSLKWIPLSQLMVRTMHIKKSCHQNQRC